MAKKIRVGVLFGGRSAEHEVSLVSAASIINALDKEKYDIIPIGITTEGRWLSAPNALQLLKNKSIPQNLSEHIIVPNPQKQSLIDITAVQKEREYYVDVIFPIIHGTFGEDGTMQGLLELADIPYVGAGVLGSAVGMDKVIQKQLLQNAKIPVTKYIAFLYKEFLQEKDEYLAKIEKTLKYPCFIKPPNQGSSVGISKAHNRKELIEAINLARSYDRKILIEEGIEQAREIECSVLGNDEPKASVLGEIIPSNEFYDYDAKYVDGKSVAKIPAELPKVMVKKIQKYALDAYKILDCAGMARVDFLVEGNGKKIYLNEINTIPGFTSISMYPKLWEATGVSYPELLDTLIELALERYRAKRELKTLFTPKSDWYKK